ncbi:hypothetical protein GCM10009863_65610 [Streptomyces axinellae]|uniref:Uncharacterized protein n=1 Tax=Streptomyces axinellae TaxID=552788 RepID=A0ABN3R0A4_9ACTN
MDSEGNPIEVEFVEDGRRTARVRSAASTSRYRKSRDEYGAAVLKAVDRANGRKAPFESTLDLVWRRARAAMYYAAGKDAKSQSKDVRELETWFRNIDHQAEGARLNGATPEGFKGGCVAGKTWTRGNEFLRPDFARAAPARQQTTLASSSRTGGHQDSRYAVPHHDSGHGMAQQAPGYGMAQQAPGHGMAQQTPGYGAPGPRPFAEGEYDAPAPRISVQGGYGAPDPAWAPAAEPVTRRPPPPGWDHLPSGGQEPSYQDDRAYPHPAATYLPPSGMSAAARAHPGDEVPEFQARHDLASGGVVLPPLVQSRDGLAPYQGQAAPLPAIRTDVAFLGVLPRPVRGGGAVLAPLSRGGDVHNPPPNRGFQSLAPGMRRGGR